MFRKRINMEKVVPSSKMTLKLSCLAACNNDVKRAQELYDFLASDLPSLPDLEPAPVSGFERVKSSADDIFSWLGEHRDDITGIVDTVRSFLPGKSAAGSVVQAVTPNVPPIPQP